MNDLSDARDAALATAAVGPSTTAPLVLFAVAVLVSVLSFGGSILLVSRGARSDAPLATATPGISEAGGTAALTSPPRAQSPAPAAVRVVGTSGSSEPISGNKHRVTFVWSLEGARDGDSAAVRFFAGSRPVSEQRGVLDPNSYSASSGRLTLVTSQDCSPDGWSAELASVRNQPPLGDSTARVPGVVCR